MSPKKPTKTDAYIAKRIKEARGDLTQEQLSGRLGIKYQQLQKYESCKNRVSASRLLLIARATKRPINFFFRRTVEGLMLLWREVLRA